MADDVITKPPVPLKWVGPAGHRSRLCGDLVPGRAYPIPDELVETFLSQTGFWERPAAAAKKKEG